MDDVVVLNLGSVTGMCCQRAAKEDEIWSVQRILTQLNRRNRQMKGMARSLSADDNISAEKEKEGIYSVIN